jgi:hypothetical protein
MTFSPLPGAVCLLTLGTNMLRSGIRDVYGRFEEFGQSTKWTPFFRDDLQNRPQ